MDQFSKFHVKLSFRYEAQLSLYFLLIYIYICIRSIN